jgi:hypothetical protein
MIRRFFSGLDCKRILVLLRYPSDIGFLDSNHELPVRKDPKVERYRPLQVRALVQFENSPAALLACERSKEIMSLADLSAQPTTAMIESGTAPADTAATEGAGDQVKGAAVAVTPVLDKYAARTIVDYVAIDASSPSHSKTPLHAVESRVRDDLDPLVERILWTAALRALVGIHAPETGGARSTTDASADWRPYSRLIEGPSMKLSRLPSTKQDDERLERLRRHREKVQKDRDRLLFPSDKPLWVMRDPHVARSDPVTRLTCRAAECLRDEVERCDRSLVQWRVHRFLSAEP